MLNHKYAVRYKETGDIYKTFEYWGEALYCITDSFGPEGHLVEAIELDSEEEIKYRPFSRGRLNEE